ncbi:MAG: DUF2934 domain-containing protein [Rhodospirillales bacterium]|nr:MAG: DUF2934 domain-containing protein [Rhodospirillales bacterium]
MIRSSNWGAGSLKAIGRSSSTTRSALSSVCWAARPARPASVDPAPSRAPPRKKRRALFSRCVLPAETILSEETQGRMATAMNTDFTEQVRSLAYGMWRSAGQECERAFDYWLMAEQMVLEVMTTMTRVGASTAKSTAASMLRTRSLMASLYLEKVRDLAYQMWEAGGQQYGRAMDYWIAAERHVTATMMTQAQASPSAGPEAAAKAVEAFSATEHLERIRLTAYYMWEQAGRQYGDSLEYWLAAEREILAALGAERPPEAGSAAPEGGARGEAPESRGGAAAGASATASTRPAEGRVRASRPRGTAAAARPATTAPRRAATNTATNTASEAGAADGGEAGGGETGPVIRVRRLGGRSGPSASQ